MRAFVILSGARRAVLLAFLFGILPVGAARAAGAEAKPRILVLGDSLAAGYGVDQKEAFPALLQEKVEAAGLDYTVVNAGLSGDTSAGGLRRIDWILRRPVDVLFLELGGNDGLRGLPPAETKRNLQSIIDKTREKHPRARVIIAGMQMPGNLGAAYQAEFQAVFADLAKENKAALIPFLLEGVGGDARLNQPDRIHPTAEGHKIIAEKVWPALKAALEREP